MSTRRVPETDAAAAYPPGTQRVNTRLEIPAATLTKVGATALLTLAAIWLLSSLARVIILMLLALMFAVVLSDLVDWLVKKRIPRGLATLISMAAVMLVVGVVLVVTIPPLVTELDKFLDNLPQTAASLRGRLAGSPEVYDALAQRIEAFRRDPTGLLSGALRFGFGAASFTFTGVLLLTLAAYFLIDEEHMRQSVLRFTPARYRERVDATMSGTAEVFRAYFIGRSMVSAIFAIFTFLLLTVLKVPYAVVFAVLGFFLGAIPNFGSLLATVVPALVALAYRGITTAVIVAAALIAYNQVENNFIQPRIMSKKLAVTPAATLIGVLIGGKLLGVIGVILAIPIVGMLPVLDRVWWSREEAEVTPLVKSSSKRD